MAQIMIKKKHCLPKEELKVRLDPLLDRTAAVYGLRYSWEDDICRFDGASNGYLKISDSTVIIAVRLGIFDLARKTIEEEISRDLDRLLNSKI